MITVTDLFDVDFSEYSKQLQAECDYTQGYQTGIEFRIKQKKLLSGCHAALEGTHIEKDWAEGFFHGFNDIKHKITGVRS